LLQTEHFFVKHYEVRFLVFNALFSSEHASVTSVK